MHNPEPKTRPPQWMAESWMQGQAKPGRSKLVGTAAQGAGTASRDSRGPGVGDFRQHGAVRVAEQDAAHAKLALAEGFRHDALLPERLLALQVETQHVLRGLHLPKDLHPQLPSSCASGSHSGPPSSQ